MSYEDKKTRKSRRAGKTKQELLDLFYQMAYRTERTGKLEDGCFVDLMVCSHCNLNCAGCDHYAALQQPYFVDIDTLEDLVFFPNLQNLNLSFCSKLKDLKGISNCTNLSTFTILGSNRTSNRFQ